VVERNLDRLTVGAATIFGVTSVLLAIMLKP
jgi:preprotein translocase subunit SecG